MKILFFIDMKKQILLVDDEQDILEILSYNLNKEGYDVITAANGKEVFEKKLDEIDLIVLDIMLPELDGFEVCRKLKKSETTSKIPIIFLSAKTSEIDEVLGIEIGAEDYITKPISIRKLLTRIKNVLRRENLIEQKNEIISFDDLTIYPENYVIKYEGNEIAFTKKEFESLLFLINNRGKIVTREKLLNAVWGENVYVIPRTIDVHIRRIREKLGSKANLVETIKGIGYRIK